MSNIHIYCAADRGSVGRHRQKHEAIWEELSSLQHKANSDLYILYYAVLLSNNDKHFIMVKRAFSPSTPFSAVSEELKPDD